MKIARYGIFTRWAKVICTRCHNLHVDGNLDARRVPELQHEFDNDRVFNCEGCAEPMGFDLDNEFAELLQMREALWAMGYSEVELQQTGGMCYALVCFFRTGRLALVVTNMLSEGMEVGLYLGDEPFQWGDDAPLDYDDNLDFDSALEFWVDHVPAPSYPDPT